MLETIINTGLDIIISLRCKAIHSNEPPWINPALKYLIKRRQKALAHDNLPLFRLLRNRVNRERKTCRGKYYRAKIAHLKEFESAVWWKEVKKLSGMSSAFCHPDDFTKTLIHHIDTSPNKQDLANSINKTFLMSMKEFPPLSNDYKSEQCDFPSSSLLVVTAPSVYKVLSKLNPTKAQGPDGVPAWLLKENADVLKAPIMDILNSSYSEGCLPLSWKMADIVPVPKQKPVTDVNKHLRPISLTPILSKVAEEFIVEEYVKPAILMKISANQFGCVPKSSTTHALISMMHMWAKRTDGNEATIRVVLFDYRKAFDLIGHTILVSKFKIFRSPIWKCMLGHGFFNLLEYWKDICADDR